VPLCDNCNFIKGSTFFKNIQPTRESRWSTENVAIPSENQIEKNEKSEEHNMRRGVRSGCWCRWEEPVPQMGRNRWSWTHGRAPSHYGPALCVAFAFDATLPLKYLAAASLESESRVKSVASAAHFHSANLHPHKVPEFW
jgi:hypothetical protein